MAAARFETARSTYAHQFWKKARTPRGSGPAQKEGQTVAAGALANGRDTTVATELRCPRRRAGETPVQGPGGFDQRSSISRQPRSFRLAPTLARANAVPHEPSENSKRTPTRRSAP